MMAWSESATSVSRNSQRLKTKMMMTGVLSSLPLPLHSLPTSLATIPLSSVLVIIPSPHSPPRSYLEGPTNRLISIPLLRQRDRYQVPITTRYLPLHATGSMSARAQHRSDATFRKMRRIPYQYPTSKILHQLVLWLLGQRPQSTSQSPCQST